ncbi:MAG: fibronectin type III domain-containing protein [Candidatus Hydrogenedentes bacterium]|nr:fibronectin type III domain-containing protein [Candidatus Hydrogenedentota bacterium]
MSVAWKSVFLVLLYVFMPGVTWALEGTVSYSDGGPAAGAVVTLRDDAGNSVSATCDADGGFSLGASEKDKSTGGGRGTKDDLSVIEVSTGNGQSYGGIGLPGSVAQGGTVAIVLQAAPAKGVAGSPKEAVKAGAYTLGGTVYGGPNPLPGVVVMLSDAITQTQLDTTTTGDDGRYSFSADNGTYNLLLTPPSGTSFVQSVVNNIAVNGANVTQNVVLLEAQRTLSGTVYAPDGVTPLEGAWVQAWSWSTGNSAQTDSSGHYSIPLPGDLTYTLSVGGGRESLVPSIDMPDSFGFQGLAPDVLMDRNRTQDFVLLPPVHLSGQTLVNGTPVADTWVSAGTSSDVGPVTFSSSSSVYADAGGNYDLLLLPGTCSGTGYPPTGSGAVTTNFGPIEVPGDTVYDINLDSTFFLSGTVTAADGLTPVSGLTVWASEGSTGNSAITDSAGYYSIELWSGTFTIYAYGNATELNIPAPDSIYLSRPVPDVELSTSQVRNFSLPPIMEASGRTLGNGSPVPFTDVSVGTEFASIDPEGPSYSSGSSVTSDASGNYSVLLTPGDASFYARPYEGSGFTQTSYANVAVAGNTVYDINLTPLITLGGTVYAADGVTAVSGVYVGLCPWWFGYGTCSIEDGTGGSIGISPVAADANGHYEFAVPTGTYQLYLGGSGADLNVPAPDYFYLGPVASVAVTGKAVKDLQIPAYVHLSGQVLGNGSPVPDSQVSAGTNYSSGDFYSTSGSSAVSDSNGQYDVLLLEGLGSVSAYPPDGAPFVATSYSDIPVAGNTAYDIVLTPLHVVSGTVFAADGVTPVSNLEVSFSGNYGTSAITDSQGHYEMNLTSGTYDVGVGTSPYVGPPNIPCPSSFSISSILAGVVVSGSMTQDLILPEFIKLSGYATDSNGVPVPEVSVSTATGGSSGNSYWNTSGSGTSAANGYYEMLLLPGECSYVYITPPPDSGFLSAYLNCVDIPGNLLQNVILSIEDTRAPLIISGPFVRSITDTSTVIEWETDEVASSDVQYGEGQGLGSSASVPGDVRHHSVPLTGLTPGTEYSVQVSSMDAAGNGPTTSGIISFTTLSEPVVRPPLIVEGPNVTSVTHNSAVVEWMTNVAADSGANYGATPGLGTGVEDGALVLSHSLVLPGLTPNTEHFVQVDSVDAFGNGPTASNVISFFTLAEPDTLPPVITNGPLALDVTDTEAMILWDTDEPATSGVSYNDGTVYGVVQDPTLRTNHSVRLTGLTPGTLYHFTVSSLDGLNNGPTLAGPFDFMTLLAPDTTGPVIIEGPEVVNVTHQSAVIRWKTDEASDSVVEYGLTPGLGSQDSRSALTRLHNMTLVGLAEATRHYYRVSSRDSAGNGVVSTIDTFVTDLIPDRNSPQATNGPTFQGAAGGKVALAESLRLRRPPTTIVGATDSRVTVYFQTDEPSDTVLDYVDSGNRHRHRAENSRTTEHLVTLTNLSGGENYGLGIRSTDLGGNVLQFENSDGNQGLKALIPFTVGEADITPPVIVEGPTIVSVTDTTATVRWVTDELADTRVSYGLEGGALEGFTGDITYATEHLVVLTNLAPSTAYSLKAASRDVAGNGPTEGSVLGFSTGSSPDTTSPAFTTTPTAVDIGTSEAAIAWETDEFATSQVRFGVAADALDSIAAVVGLSTGHRVALTNLTPATTYYFAAVSRDSSGNVAVSVAASFTTEDDLVTVFEDIDSSGGINAVDVQLVINAALGLSIGNLNADVDRNNTVDAVDVQLVINAALGIF